MALGPSGLPGARLIGGLLVAATVVAGVSEWRDARPRDGGAPREAPGAAAPGLTAPANAAKPVAGAVAPSQSASDETGIAAGAIPAAVVPADPAQAFLAAVQAARERPASAPPPGIATARSLPEAFEAMRSAQAEPASALAGASPFGRVAR